MRRIAADLGVGTMSLYNYLPTKEHLVQLMIDQAAGEYSYPDRSADPRWAVMALARQGRDIAQRHPWLAVLARGPQPMGPNLLRYLDYFLGLLADSALDVGAKLEFVSLINGFALMYGALQAALGAERTHTGVTAEEQTAAPVAALAAAAASGKYPNLAAALAAPTPPPRDADTVFDSCVTLLIDGALAG
jgi:AcrR family transcriptional regulator